MTDLLTGLSLRRRLRELTEQSYSVDIAVAWATSWDGLDEVLEVAKHHSKEAVRILVGTSGFVTSPTALRKLSDKANLRIYEKHGDSLFHPKLYIFGTPAGRVSWVGSANLTWRAFKRNIEAVAEISNADESTAGYFEKLWKEGIAVSAEFLDGYEERCLEAARSRPDFLRGEVDVPSDAEALRAGWTDYALKLRTYSDLDRRLRTLKAGYDFVRRDWAEPLTDREDAIMRGLKYGEESFKSFGELKRIDRSKFDGQSRESLMNRLKIQEAVRRLDQMKLFQAPLVEGAVHTLFKDVVGCGEALATRLLIFARPDWFTVYNEKSWQWLSREFKLGTGTKVSVVQYVRLIQTIHLTDWWSSPAPNNDDDLAIWRYRCALLDCFAYDSYQSGMQ